MLSLGLALSGRKISMTTARTINTFMLLLLPLVVAVAELGWLITLTLLLLLLLWRWLITLSGISAPVRTLSRTSARNPARNLVSRPELVLDSISASHYVEKVRWCLDRLGVAYQEQPAGGTLGAFFLGRTVPRLRCRTGLVQSSIGNSTEILRYLWGRYHAELPENAEFLRADAQRLQLEQHIDRAGRDLQVWVYYHLLPHRALTLHAWGANNPAVPAWQRGLLRVLFPLLRLLIRRAFGINTARYKKAVQHVEQLLLHGEQALADGRGSLLGGDALNYTDITFAAINGLWLMPVGYGGGQADAVRLATEQLPARMVRDIQHWRQEYPLSTTFIEQLYLAERKLPGAATRRSPE
jgi:glutathione S-transferase